MDITTFLLERITIDGCTIEVHDTEVVVHTPDITENTHIIKLEDNDELRILSHLLAGRKLVQQTERVSAPCSLLSIERLIV